MPSRLGFSKASRWFPAEFEIPPGILSHSSFGFKSLHLRPRLPCKIAFNHTTPGCPTVLQICLRQRGHSQVVRLFFFFFSARAFRSYPTDRHWSSRCIENVPATRRSPSPEDASQAVVTKTYGGFESLNWESYRQNIDNFRPKWHSAKDLPHSLQDHIQQWTPLGQRLIGLRTVLECYIQEHTGEDEPSSPHIRVKNDVDDDPTPPWEFHYSNKMWHGEGVPPPDISNLTSCDCSGKCNRNSLTCPCITRQQRYTEDGSKFIYDDQGRLKLFGYPIFECNDMCRCDDTCPNRVCSQSKRLTPV